MVFFVRNIGPLHYLIFYGNVGISMPICNENSLCPGVSIKKELYNWIRNEGTVKPARKKLLLVNTAEHPGSPLFESKMEAIRRCFELGESIKSLSEEIAIPEPAFTAGCCGIRSPGREGVSFCVCGLL